MTPNLTVPKSSRDAFAQIVDLLGAEKVADVLGCSYTHVRRMAADSKTNAETRRNTIEAYESLLDETFDFNLAFCVVDRAANKIGCELKIKDSDPDEKSLAEELTEDTEALCYLHKTAISYQKGKATEEELRYAISFVKKEADETFQAASNRVNRECL